MLNLFRRRAALSPTLRQDLAEWQKLCPRTDPEAWVFPSERLVTAVSKDNWWRRSMLPVLEQLNLSCATFQVMRRTHASLSRRSGIDPKLVADQLSHGLGVNLDVYTKPDLSQRSAAVSRLEAEIIAA